MYIINNYCYGIDINKLMEENENFPVWVLDEYFDNGKEFDLGVKGFHDDPLSLEINTWYHGGCSQDYFPGVVGILITDDDCNPDFVKIIRKADETYFRSLWDTNVEALIKACEDDLSESINLGELNPKEVDDIKFVINCLKQETPEFYTVEGSS